MRQLLSATYHFSLEILLGLIILYLFYTNKEGMPPVALLLLLSLGSLILFSLLLIKYSEKGKWLYFITVAPLLIFMGNQLEVSKYLLVIIAVLVFWRGILLHREAGGYFAGTMLLITLPVGIICLIFASASNYPFMSHIVIILIVQGFLVLLGEFLKKWGSINEDRASHAVFFGKLLGAICLIAFSIAFLLKPLQLIFFKALKTFALVFAYIMTPLLSGLQILQITGCQRKSSEVEMSGQDEQLPFQYKERSYIPIEDIMFVIVVLLVIVFLAYLFIKKKINLLPPINKFSDAIEISTGRLGVNRKSILSRRIKPPGDIIRREIFELERFAYKYNSGRLLYETVEEWLHRIGFTDVEQVIKIYEKLRYGHESYTSGEKTSFMLEISRMKQHIKDRSKVSDK
ncbi:hypothetical protein [Bacillus sp. MRMR6]|uniref:hypothetical protein n=1 Tax=Bacillus sp. MRMR6 TaxID=1928617 RepID=UPI0009520250|nr:hypothetical protein [Bacillus sp. MRMR6]OLS41916.1 hypothetical protein BTR25_00680 [Bacillus sp. MRMR6]